MRFFRSFLDRQKDRFQSGGRLDSLYPLFEAVDTIFYTPDTVTSGTTHVRDALDLKRMMSVVVAALMPIVFFAMYNTGLQANRAIVAGATPLDDWQTRLFQALGFGFTTDFWASLILPPTIPLWQVASGAVFGVLIGKEIFGGTGMNVLNPALTARAFLFFAYPAEISGDKPWIAADFIGVDGFSGATWLARATAEGPQVLGQVGGTHWMDAFLGFIPGSMGETSALLCLVGAVILIVTRIGSWRTMLGVVVGTAGMATLLNVFGSETNPAFAIPFAWHVVLGGWALGTVFMATDPVSSAFTDKGRLIYGFGIGVMVILVRAVNPAYPEGMMLAILFMNMFAPFIDHFFVQANIKRRLA
ncbi:MAG: RnfABCDGE type electron transport complex subunit D, partial [Acidobacteria bacterium]|nr:RnfABCDGE type electron transport complex subunit D [Candidatus Sulfomarinibacter sp. MAG AM2]